MAVFGCVECGDGAGAAAALGRYGGQDDAAVAGWRSGSAGKCGCGQADADGLSAVGGECDEDGSGGRSGGRVSASGDEKEGTAVAQWLNAQGVAAFVLKYRLGPTYHNPIELGDAQRAIRMVRAHAAEYGVAEDHIGMWGFSAGGHLTATAGTHFDAGNPSAADPIERQGSRPDFLILAIR